MDNGVSGLIAEQGAIGVAGDNIANVNTTGFKRQRALFEDVFMRNGGGGGQGAGVRQGALQQAFVQGSLENTGVATDLGISGGGFFAVSGSVDGISGTFYSRSGQFRVNTEGALVDPSGMKLLGYQALPDGTMSASVAPIVIPTSGIPAQATDGMRVTANLNAAAEVTAAAFDVNQPSQTANFSTSVQVYDSLGNPHDLAVYFKKTGDGQWDYHVLAKGSETTPSSTDANVEVGSGALQFTTQGALNSLSGAQAINVTFGSAEPQAITLNLGSSLADGGTGLDGLTQFASPSNVSSSSQNGYSAGEMSGVAVKSNGVVEGLYTNGMRLPVGQIALANFRSESGLARAGNGLWISTAQSGQAALGTPGSGGRGAISAGTLETSNVDLAQEFTDMITHQRAFSANSKVIAAADDMLTALMQVKK